MPFPCYNARRDDEAIVPQVAATSGSGIGETWSIERSGDIATDVERLLTAHNRPHTASHSQRVADEARRLALHFGVDPAQAETAGWLHDVSVVIPAAEWVDTAHA